MAETTDIVTEEPIVTQCVPPTHHDIAPRAFELWIEGGELEGTDKDNWRAAEIELWTNYVREKDALDKC